MQVIKIMGSNTNHKGNSNHKNVIDSIIGAIIRQVNNLMVCFFTVSDLIINK